MKVLGEFVDTSKIEPCSGQGHARGIMQFTRKRILRALGEHSQIAPAREHNHPAREEAMSIATAAPHNTKSPWLNPFGLALVAYYLAMAVIGLLVPDDIRILLWKTP